MAIQQRASGLARLQNLLDRVISPTTRQDVYKNVSTFSQEQPYVASFLALQILLSFTPLFLFISFSTSVFLLSIISAILFSLFWIGIALLLLIPTLFVTVSLGIAIWVWTVSSFVVAKWIYVRLPVRVSGRTEIGAVNGEGKRKIVIEKSGQGFGDLSINSEKNIV